MELYASSEELFRLESIYPSLSDQEKLNTLLSITWHIRQRDCQRALFQVDELEQPCFEWELLGRIHLCREVLRLRRSLTRLCGEFSSGVLPSRLQRQNRLP